MLNRRLASLLAAVTAAGLAATGCAVQAAAVQVGDATVSRRDFEDQLDFVYENDDFRSLLFGEVGREELRAEGDPRGSFTQPFVGAMAGVQVQFMLVEQVLDDEGIELTDADREAVTSEIDPVVPGGVDGLPDSMRDDFVDGLAGINTLATELGEEEFNAVMLAAFDEAGTNDDITINSRYGSWDPDTDTVTPPGGPAPAPGAADPSADLTPG